MGLNHAVRLAATLTRTGSSAFLVVGWDPGMKGDGGDILDDVWELKLGADTQPTWREVELQVATPRLQTSAGHCMPGMVKY